MRFRTVNHLIAAGTRVLTQPRYSTAVVVAGSSYYYWGGMYYASSGSGYVVVGPPLGAVVYAVPTATTVVYVGPTPYYYYGGTYYVTTTEQAQQPDMSEQAPADAANVAPGGNESGDAQDLPPMTEDPDHNYKVVAPPIGVTVPYLSDDAKEKTINGKKYFVDGNTYYQPFVGDGDTIYMVVENPQGDSNS